LGALHERHATGRGRYIDISLVDGLINMLGYYAQLAWLSGQDPQPLGSEHPNLVPYGVFPASDGAMVIACLTDGFWARICGALGVAEAANDPRYDSLAKRRAERAAVNALVASRTQTMTMAELEAVFVEHAVPHAPILGVTAALAQPQVVAREMVVEVEHSALGPIPIVNRPFKFGDAVQPAPTAPPALGEHGAAILRDVLNMDAAAISDLQARGVVG
jgi:crotonobetainyl-CoA:carnitine CoA-transferase CaiB-like acyl-CoA transferase